MGVETASLWVAKTSLTPFVTQIASIFRVQARDECTLHVKVFLDFSIILQNISNNNSSIKSIWDWSRKNSFQLALGQSQKLLSEKSSLHTS